MSSMRTTTKRRKKSILSNGLRAAEMVAPHIARRHVISFVVNGKSMNSHEEPSTN